MRTRIDYYRKYNETHRDELNRRGRERYEARKDLIKRRDAFSTALDEITDGDVRREYECMLDVMTTQLIDRGFAPLSAERGALEILAALTWKGVNAPRKRQAVQMAGD